MNRLDDFVAVEKLVFDARRSLGREVMRQGIQQIVASIRQELGNHRDRIDDPARFLEELKQDGAAKDLITPEISELLEAFRKSTKSVSGLASVSVRSAPILPSEPSRKAAVVPLPASRPASVSVRPEPLPLPVRAKTPEVRPGSPACDEDIDGDIDVPISRIDKIARKKSYIRKRIMAMARNFGEVSVGEALKQLRGLKPGQASVRKVILELEGQGFLELLHTDSYGNNTYRPTSKPSMPESNVPSALPQPSQKTAPLPGTTEGPGCTSGVSGKPARASSPVPINPKHPGLDDLDEIVMRTVRSKGSITKDGAYARFFRMDEYTWIIRLDALVNRGLLRRVGDKEDERFFPV